MKLKPLRGRIAAVGGLVAAAGLAWAAIEVWPTLHTSGSPLPTVVSFRVPLVPILIAIGGGALCVFSLFCPGRRKT